MINVLAALIGIPDDYDNSDSWENDENDLDDDEYQADDDTGDEPENVKPWLGWFGL